MYRKAAVIAASAVAVVGVGSAVAVAASNSGGSSPLALTSPSPSATGSTSGSTTGSTAPGTKTRTGKHKHGGHEKGLYKKLEHGTVVVQGEDGKAETITLIQGTVTAVSASSISVQALDKTTQTYTVNSATAVHSKGTHGKSTISTVAKGDHVLVAGTGQSVLTATRVVDTGK